MDFLTVRFSISIYLCLASLNSPLLFRLHFFNREKNLAFRPGFSREKLFKLSITLLCFVLQPTQVHCFKNSLTRAY